MRSATTVLIALLAGLLAASCTSGGTGNGGGAQQTTAPATTAPTGAPGSPTTAVSDVIVLVGQPEATAEGVRLIRTYETRVNAKPGAGDMVLFTVSAVDGPMPQTREQIEALRGVPYGPSAILLVRTDEQDDPELRALVVQETRELLRRYEHPRSDELPVIAAEDPNLALLLRGLAAQR